ncbi:MAG: hypothetical protein QF858_02070 [Candidatus Pacebacteria bacterium]|nr:hypothetical protein [Candidatus Paceibacterota bacterium]MDP6659442.1 hypothetical protein [Candidatus Paceibacterota bacterium]
MIFSLDKRLAISLLIIVTALSISAGIVVHAQSDDLFADIEYPIAELGNCESRSDCESYCGSLDHIDECISYAEAHNLLTPEEIEEAKTFAEIGSVGPGGCRSHDECDDYCSDINNIEECIAFGEEHDLISEEELEEARKMLNAINSGVALPGGCTDKESCEIYCEDGANIDECIAFAEAAGLMSPDELEEARKFRDLLAAGDTPGGCQGRDECEAFCEDDINFDECIAFAERAGVVSPEELEMIKKTGGKGPGGCKGHRECEDFCNNPANQQICFEFAQEHDILPEGDKERFEEGLIKIREGLEQAPPAVFSCLEDKLGSNTIAQIRSGNFFPSPQIGDAMRGCFEEFDERGGPDGGPGDALHNAPLEVLNCIESSLGSDGLKAVEEGDFENLGPEAEIAFKKCFENSGEDFPVGDREFLPIEFELENFDDKDFRDEFDEDFLERREFFEDHEKEFRDDFDDRFEGPLFFDEDERHFEDDDRFFHRRTI